MQWTWIIVKDASYEGERGEREGERSEKSEIKKGVKSEFTRILLRKLCLLTAFEAWTTGRRATIKMWRRKSKNKKRKRKGSGRKIHGILFSPNNTEKKIPKKTKMSESCEGESNVKKRKLWRKEKAFCKSQRIWRSSPGVTDEFFR